MSCTGFKEKVEAYADGILDAAARAEVEAHLTRCAECAAEVRRFQRLSELLGASRDVEPSPRFEAAFLRRLRAEAEPKPSWVQRWFGRPWGLAVAGAAAAAIVAVALWPRGAERSVPPERPPVALDVVRHLDLLKDLDAVANLDLLEGVSAEEFEAVSEMPELGG